MTDWSELERLPADVIVQRTPRTVYAVRADLAAAFSAAGYAPGSSTELPSSDLAGRNPLAELVAHGQPLTLFGDSLFVDFDLSLENLPTGSHVRVGEAVVEVTSMPHDGCSKFKKRFGADALLFVNARATRHLNLRGIYWKVIEPGEVRVGSSVEVLSRPGMGSD